MPRTALTDEQRKARNRKQRERRAKRKQEQKQQEQQQEQQEQKHERPAIDTAALAGSGFKLTVIRTLALAQTLGKPGRFPSQTEALAYAEGLAIIDACSALHDKSAYHCNAKLHGPKDPESGERPIISDQPRDALWWNEYFTNATCTAKDRSRLVAH